MDIEEVYVEMERTNITSPECIMCGRCVESCPEEGALSMNYMGKELARSRSPASRRDEIEGRLECPPRLEGEIYNNSEDEETEVET
jgi:ferredoxin